MQPKPSLFSALAALLLISSLVRSEGIDQAARYSLQVAAFPESEFNQRLIDKLKQAGERPVWGTVELPDRGRWVRVFVGSFNSAAQARAYGERLVGRGIIREFIVRSADNIRALSRPRSVTKKQSLSPRYNTLAIIKKTPARAPAERERAKAKEPVRPNRASVSYALNMQTNLKAVTSRLTLGGEERFTWLPVEGSVALELIPDADVASIPRPDPMRVAFAMLVDKRRQRDSLTYAGGGLWLSGDLNEALARLRWIVGPANAEAITVDETGRVRLNTLLLAESAGISDANQAAAPVVAAGYIASNEGLLLLVQMTQGAYRYCLHIGRGAPTFGGEVAVSGSINLDNNYDSRINPYRRLHKKLDQELPPEGFDSMIAMNPTALWFNLRAGRLVPVGHITFHELSEAHAKVALGLEYLAQGTRPGAHNIALEREKRLKMQRPFSDVVVTTGSNRVLRSEAEIRRFYEEIGAKSREQR